MYILFKRHGADHLFRNYQSKDELQAEVAKGHNEKFLGNNQFCYDTHTKEFEILNPRLTLSICQQRLYEAEISKSVESLNMKLIWNNEEAK